MKKVLILGGTGRLGQMLVKRLNGRYEVTTLARSAAERCHIQADIRDFDGYEGFDTVIHCAAMKDVVKCENNIEECIAINVTGTAAALRNAAKAGVKKYIYISTDMAVEPHSVYGTSKKLADAMVVDAARIGKMQTAVIRLGNIIASKGSILNLFAEKSKELGYVPVTDERMTRFLMSAENCADFVIEVSKRDDLDGSVFVPKCKSYRITDVAEAVAPEVPVKIIGLRPGDMLSVTMIASNEVQRVLSEGNLYKILPVWKEIKHRSELTCQLTSANNEDVASVEELRSLYISLSTSN